MCDSLCVVTPHGTIFAKNSDRPLDEIQTLQRYSRRASNDTRPLHTQYLDIGPDPGAFATIGSQPNWLWGFEHGMNEHGVAIDRKSVV